MVHRQLKNLIRHYTSEWLNNYYIQESGSYYVRVLDELYFKNREEIKVVYLNVIRLFLTTNSYIKLNFKNSEAWIRTRIDNGYGYDEMLSQLMELFTSQKDFLFIEDLCRKAVFEWKIRNFISFLEINREM